ncbi:MAG: hypothetical protein ACJA1C_003021 [Crocinitomicaceae bacterium]|jgi:hypothetical protein
MKIVAATILVKNQTLEEVDAYFNQPSKFDADNKLIDEVPKKHFVLRIPLKVKGSDMMMPIPSVISTIKTGNGVEVICTSKLSKPFFFSMVVSLVPSLIIVIAYEGSNNSIMYAAMFFSLLLGGVFITFQAVVARKAEEYLKVIFNKSSKIK